LTTLNLMTLPTSVLYALSASFEFFQDRPISVFRAGPPSTRELVNSRGTFFEFSHDTTTNIHDSRGLLRILEGVRWSHSPGFVCVVQGSRRDNVSTSFLQSRPGGISNPGPRHFLSLIVHGNGELPLWSYFSLISFPHCHILFSY